MILPVFSLYGDILEGATPLLIGVAIGAYGLTQALLQVPFGLLSDRIGRKPVIAGGLMLFIVGSVIAALSSDIYGVIIGRALQGSGAIAAAVMALTADLTREEHRTKAMAIIGMSIGLSFTVALVAGPVLNGWIGLSGIFWVTAALAGTGLIMLLTTVPTPAHSRVHRDAELVPAQLSQVISDGQLLRLDAGILLLHMIMTALFVAMPLVLRDVLGIDGQHHWTVYLPVLLLSVIAMVPFMLFAERKRRVRLVFTGAVVVLCLSQLGLVVSGGHAVSVVVFLFVFFTAFNYLEASLPSLVSRVAPADKKGTALGVYTSAQFLGAFLGGTLGGWCLGQYGVSGVFAITSVMGALWIAVTLGLRDPRYLRNVLLQVGPCDEDGAAQLAARLAGVSGVAEAVVLAEEGVAYLKVECEDFDLDTLQHLAAQKG